MCNYRHRGESHLEWGTGSSVLGNWSTELGEIFYESLSQSGVNVAGDPRDLFGKAKKAQSAEYMIGARISKIASNICQQHDFWDGRPENKFSGEMFIDVEWSIFSTIAQEEVLRFETQGYFIQKEPKSDGISLVFHNAFAHAAEELVANAGFRRLAIREEIKNQQEIAESFERLILPTQPLMIDPIKDNIAPILSAVATIRVGAGHGSGFFITKNGYLLTNAHVVGEAEKVAIILNNGLEIEGEVLRRSKVNDVALIKVGIRVPHPLPIRNEPVTRLERVFAIGSPRSEQLKSTMTSGVVSGFRTSNNQRRIQADVAISGGNSGGPLVDESGNVVGISVSKIAETGVEGISFFIPIVDSMESINLSPLVSGS